MPTALHIFSDGLIALSFLLIVAVLLLVVRRRRGVQFPRLFAFMLLGLLGCAATHALAVVDVWTPVYRLAAVVGTVTAVLLISALVLLLRTMSGLESLPNPAALSSQIAEREERLRQIMDLVPDMLWSANVDTTCRFISQRYLEYTGRTMKQFENDGFHAIFHPDDLPKVKTSYGRAIETGEPEELELRIRRHDGVYRWFLSRTVPVRNENSRVEYLIGSVTDIHDLKRTEQALRRSNDELEQFAYAAAHDLQEPLRNVSTSLGMLERMMAERMTAEEGEWMHRSIQDAFRMQAMVKDLLLYSRVVSDDEDEEAHKTVPHASAEEAFQAALTNLNGAIAETGANVAASRLPELPVHEQHLVLLFQNLVGNSLKYRKPDYPPQIAVNAQSKGSEWEFSVSDNGIGFDPAYSERIFKVFKRLHRREEYGGNGIGLSLCARIVAHYGGRIWAEGLPGEGATFRFTLPHTAPHD